MASPITFSGFNNIDFGSIVTSLMAQASVPLTNLQTQQTNLQSQGTTVNTLGSNLDALNTAAEALATQQSLNTYQAVSSDTTAVTATAGAGASAGHYDITVNQLARGQVTASANEPDATSTTVATGGTLTIGGVAVQISGADTLQQLATDINSTQGIGVTASVVRSGASTYRLVLTGHTTGSDGAFGIVNNLTGGSGVAFTDSDGDGIAGNSPADNAVSATDAQVLVNNVLVESSSNTLTDAIPGVTLTLTKQDPTNTVSVDVSADDSALTTQVNAFIQAYNSLVSFATAQNTAAANGDPSSIGHDPLMRSLGYELQSVIGGAYSGGVFSHLSEVGVEFTQTGTLQLNQSVFDAAVADHPNDVQQLFGGTNGAFPAITGLLDQYSQSGGILASYQSQLTQESASLTQQITSMQARLAVQKTSLQEQFTAADTIISQLQSQSSALTSYVASLSSSSSSTGLTTG